LRFKTLANFALASATALLLSGCADDSPRQLYYWDGAYTSSVYEYLTQEGDAGAQIAALEESLQKAYQRAAKVPPGLHAHLGLLYLSQGNGAKFKAYVEKEAQLYPESRDYAMFLLNQNSKTQGATGKTEANLSEQTKEKSGASEPNLKGKGSNLGEQTSKQNLKTKQAKPAKTSKTAKGSQNEK
jgi:lipoprotein